MAVLSSGPDLKYTSATLVDRRDSGVTIPLRFISPPPFPVWPRLLVAALNIFVLLACITIMAILAHSLHNYSGTKDIRFGGTTISWPTNLNLYPTYLFLATSATSVAPSLLAAFLNVRRRKFHSCSTMEKALAFVSGVLVLIWIAADVTQGVSERSPKADILSWACRRRDSPTNVLVSYASVCDEQQAVKYLAVVITIAESGALVVSILVWHLVKRWSGLVKEPWRITA
ncbi:MAG: hypothetical protein Q9197_001786 [Variospora fuerteventurae]